MSEASKGAIALEFAGFWRRLGAYIIDAIVLGVASSFFEPFHWPGFGKVWDFPAALDSAVWLPQLESLANVAMFILSGIYFVIFWVWRGQTLGMMVAGVKVIRTDGTAIDAGHGIVRYVGYLVSIIPLFLGFIWIAFDSRKQGWHDKMADTYVVKLPQLPEVNTATPPAVSA